MRGFKRFLRRFSDLEEFPGDTEQVQEALMEFLVGCYQVPVLFEEVSGVLRRFWGLMEVPGGLEEVLKEAVVDLRTFLRFVRGSRAPSQGSWVRELNSPVKQFLLTPASQSERSILHVRGVTSGL